LGIGAAIAERLAADGAAITVNYGRSRDAADAVVRRIEEKGGKAIAVQADVSKLDEVKKLFAASKQAFGPTDILVNNAGIYRGAPIEQVDEEQIDAHFNLNVKGLLFATQEAVAQMNGRGGNIINISSIVAFMPPANMAVYNATKGAVDSITKTLATELGSRNIRVNSVSPGYIKTDGAKALDTEGQFESYMKAMTPSGRVGDPADIADVVAFVASEESRWITGQVIPVGGGVRF
jgi:3-oxoacyl-[acyl-carrier protein] reductase